MSRSRRSRAPLTRADCLPGGFNAERPCQWIECRYHLARPDGNRRRNALRRVWDDGGPTCALDLAESGGLSQEQTAAVLGVTRQRVQQIETHGLFELRVRSREVEQVLISREIHEGKAKQ